MKLLQNLRISAKIGMIIGLMGALSLAITAIAAWKLRSLSTEFAILTTQEYPSAERLDAAQGHAVAMVYAGYRAVSYPPESAEARSAAAEARASSAQAHAAIAAAVRINPALSAEVARYDAALDDIAPQIAATIKLAGEQRGIDSQEAVARADARLARFSNDISKRIESLKGGVKLHTDELQASAEATLWVIVACGLIGVLASTVAGLMIVRVGITMPVVKLSRRMVALAVGDERSAIPGDDRQDELGEMARAVETFREAAIAKKAIETEQHRVVDLMAGALAKLAERDLTVRITDDVPPTYQRLKDDFNAATAELADAMRQLDHSVNSVNTGASEISSASTDLSRRTEKQASSLEESAAAMDAVTRTVQDSARGAEQVNQLVLVAQDDAEEGGRVVREAIAAMGSLAGSSHEIEQIVSLIDGIAFQTNLLALNAGVEAARAGDAGRGFAVVANEVRALAQRSAEAARDIKGLITSSSRHVTEGVELVGKTGQALDRIVARVAEISALAGRIEQATAAQATSIAQVNGAVAEMDRTTQQNAAMVEETTAAARSLTEEAGMLGQLVARFTLGERAAAAAPAPARSPARGIPAVQGNLAVKLAEPDEDWTEF